MDDSINEAPTVCPGMGMLAPAPPKNEHRVDWAMRQFIDEQVVDRCRKGRTECLWTRDCMAARTRMSARGVSLPVQARIIEFLRPGCGTSRRRHASG